MFEKYFAVMKIRYLPPLIPPFKGGNKKIQFPPLLQSGKQENPIPSPS